MRHKESVTRQIVTFYDRKYLFDWGGRLKNVAKRLRKTPRRDTIKYTRNTVLLHVSILYVRYGKCDKNAFGQVTVVNSEYMFALHEKNIILRSHVTVTIRSKFWRTFRFSECARFFLFLFIDLSLYFSGIRLCLGFNCVI